MADNSSAAGSDRLYPMEPDAPPGEVLHALDLAQRVISDLRSRKLEIRFEVDDGHVRAQLLDADGAIVGEIPASLGLEVLATDRAAAGP